MTVKSVLLAVDAIYETVGAAPKWPNALQRISDVFDARGAALIMRQSDGKLTTVVSPGIAAAQIDYDKEWWKQDFPSMRAIEQGYMLPGNVLTDADLVTPDEIATHPFYTEFRVKHGLGGFMGGSISPTPAVTAYITLQQVAGAPPHTDEQRAVFESLLRHCERALLLAARLEHLEDTQLSFEDGLARLGCGIVLLDEGGWIAHSNRLAQSYLDSSLKFLVRGKAGGGGSDQAELKSAIAAAFCNTPDDRSRCSRPVLVDRKGRRPLVAYVLPVRPRTDSPFWSAWPNSSVLVVLIDLDTSSDLDPALVRDYLGLTLGEARIAAHIGLGRSPREAAGELGISEETVRTSLKRVFNKTGVSRQSELAALLAKLGLVTGE